MAKKSICLKTERLFIIPMTEEELEIQIREEKDENAKKAYSDMLQKCEEEPEDFLWFVPWKIILQENKKAIGDAAFKGPQKKGMVEIGFSILPSLQRQGYMTEALGALVKWAFKQKDVLSVGAETAPGNKPSQKVLEYNGFTMYANGQDGPRYKIIKNRFFLSPFIFAGFVIAGILAGIFVKSVSPYVSVGVFAALGLSLGIVVDITAENRRKRILG